MISLEGIEGNLKWIYGKMERKMEVFAYDKVAEFQLVSIRRLSSNKTVGGERQSKLASYFGLSELE